jgi:hypothetical protein
MIDDNTYIPVKLSTARAMLEAFDKMTVADKKRHGDAVSDIRNGIDRSSVDEGERLAELTQPDHGEVVE